VVKILVTRKHYDVAEFIIDAFKAEIKRTSLNHVVNNVAALLTQNKLGKQQGRYPDVSLIDRDVWRSDHLDNRGVHEPIQVAVEVVSTNWEDDYIDKLEE
jgi:Uma2 family endonuclease